MAGPNDEIRRIDFFAGIAYIGLCINPKLRSAVEMYQQECRMTDTERAEYVTALCYERAAIAQVESEKY